MIDINVCRRLLFQVMKIMHCFKLRYISIDFTCHSSSDIFQKFSSRWGTRWMVQMYYLIRHEKNNLYPARIMDSIGVQLYGLVISTQESSFSQCNASVWHDMNFLCSLEGGSTPDHYGTSPTVSCNKCIRCEILIVPVTLDVFWAIENLLPHFSVLCLALLSKV